MIGIYILLIALFLGFVVLTAVAIYYRLKPGSCGKIPTRLLEENSILNRRLRHLLQSDFIRSFDEHDPKTHTYKRDIREADLIVKGDEK